MPEIGSLGLSRLLSDLGGRARRYWRSLVVAGATACILPYVAPALQVPILGQLPVGRFPLLGILAALAGIAALPESGMGWGTGASGEALTARALAQLKIEDNVILEDRMIAGTTTQIDCLVIGPTGVATVKTESSADRLRANDGESGGGWRTSTADAAVREAVAIEAALADQLEMRHLKVRPILCVDQARSLPSLLGTFRRPVLIVDGRGLVRLIRKLPKRLSADDVRELARVANDRLRPGTAPIPELYDPLPATVLIDRPTAPTAKPSPLRAEDDLDYMPPVRRAHIRVALEARARATDDRRYWSRGGLTAGKAPPTIPPGESRER